MSPSIEFYPSENIQVHEDKHSLRIGIPPDIKVKDLITVVNFQLGYECLRKIARPQEEKG
jgi:hypothetical protein